VSIDYQKKYGIVARRSGNLAAIRDAVQKIRAGEIEDLSDLNYQDLVQVEELQIDDQEPIRAEIEAFLNSVRTGTPPIVTAEDGLAAVETAERIIAAIPQQELK
jgi:predicted dehydrogenase